MSTETTNYHFIKPDDSDPVDNTPLNQNFDSIDAAIADHVADTNNPHQVTKEQIGLGNVDNTSDADKPISAAVQAPLARLVDAGAKNLLKIISVSKTINGITFLVNGDGIITISGTATKSTTYSLNDALELPSGRYILTGIVPKNVYLTARSSLGGNYIVTSSNGIAEINDDITYAYINISNGTELNDIVVRPMLCTTEDYAISPKFVPYRPSYDELVARIEALESGGN